MERRKARRMARRMSNHKEHKGHKEPGARQVCRATGPTDCGCAAGALRAQDGTDDFAAAMRAADEGGYQNGQRGVNE